MVEHTTLHNSVRIVNTIFDFFTKNLNYTANPELTFYVKLSITIYNLCTILILIFFIINVIITIFFKNWTNLAKIVKYLNILVISILIWLVMIKFYLTLRLESIFGMYLQNARLEFFNANTNKLGYLEHFNILSSSFSDTILLLSLLIGLFCLELLGPKNLFNSFNNVSIFYLFNLFISFMVSTNNLLIIFISFEFIFLPTIYFAYVFGYSKKIDIAAEMLIYWTLFGSFLVLCNLAYLYYSYNTLNFFFLTKINFSTSEVLFLFVNFILGFGIKVPIAPLHYWLLKVHVESPTAFSMYLSGFLVKSAIYCMYIFINIFNTNYLYLSLIVWVLYSLVISTLGLARQVDIKKLIAWATIQEMSLMVVFLVFKQMFLIHTCVLFVLLHGLMSAYMFYLVDIIQRRYKTRSLQYIQGINLIFPELTKYIWFIILMFGGFPFTIKFFIEWALACLLINISKFLLIFILFFVNFLGTVFFCKILFTLLYGSPNSLNKDINYCELQKKEKTILNTLLLTILLLLPLIYIINW